MLNILYKPTTAIFAKYINNLTFDNIGISNGKAIPVPAHYRLRGFQETEVPRFRDDLHMKGGK
jgi:hypothetical protein